MFRLQNCLLVVCWKLEFKKISFKKFLMQLFLAGTAFIITLIIGLEKFGYVGQKRWKYVWF